MNPIAAHGGEAFMNIGAGFLTGAVVAAAFAPVDIEPYGWLAMTGLALLAIGFLLKFVREDWTL